MPPGTGLESFFTFVTESVYGTDPSGGQNHRWVSASWLPAAEQTRGNRGLGRLGASGMRNRLERTEGSFTIDPQYEGAELLWLHLCGGTDNFDINTPSAGAHQHTFTPSTARQIGLTARFNEGAGPLMTPITGIKPSGMTLNFTNENLEAVINGIGLVQGASAAIETPTYPSAPDILAIDGVVGTDGLVAIHSDVGGGTPLPLNVKSATVNFALPMSTDREYLGDPVMKETVPTDIMAVSGSLTREFEDQVFADYFRLRTHRELKFTYQSEAFITGAVPYIFELKLFEVLLGSARGAVDGGGVMVETIPFVAMVSGSDFFSIFAQNGIGAAVT